MSDGTEASKVLRFEESPVRVLGRIALSGVIAALGALIIWVPNRSAGWDGPLWGLATLLVFGGIAAAGVWRFFTSPADSIVLSPAGIRVTRFGSKLVPWSEVQSVGERIFGFGPSLTLKLTPEGHRLIRRPSIWGLLHGIDRALGISYVVLPHAALDVSRHDLRRLLASYARAQGVHVGYD